MTERQIADVLEAQRAYFGTGATLNVKMRRAHLVKLKETIKKYEKDIADALYQDLGKSREESYMCEIGLVLSELSYLIKHINKFAKPQKKRTPLAQFASKSCSIPSPYGNVLVMSPWNYPFLLSIDPLAEAVAAGNTVLLKPSRYSPATNAAMETLLKEVFAPEYVGVICGGRAENETLIHSKFDYIFFTGSQKVGKIVYECAAKNLTPVTLELGGKSPVIVDKTANIKLAAKRIVFGKLLNVGQTCVAPDYLWCESSVKDELVREIVRQIGLQYPDALQNPAYGKIITQRHFERLNGLIDPVKVAFGGGSDRESLKIQPTVLDGVTFEDAVMQEEIFGPILPVMTFTDLDEVIRQINGMRSPLALYFFSEDKKAQNKVMNVCRYGGGCINDTIIHLATSYMGFGGFGDSGLGAYHGKTGFDTFTHYKSVVDKKTFMDLPMRYQPYTRSGDFLIRKFLK